MPRRILIALALLLVAAEVSALEVRGAEWGFDGTIARGRVNPLTVVVANPGAAAIEGTLTLSCGGMVRQGAPWQASFFLGAGASRVVQFYPVVDDEREFTLAWSGDRETSPVREPRDAAPTMVLLTDTRVVSAASTRVHPFAEELFPPTVAATDALGAVALDHAPRWQPAQRRAFRDWVHRGGTVFMLAAEDGVAWSLGGDLAELDGPDRDFACGAGRVVRETVTRREFSPDLAAARGYAAPPAEPTLLPRHAVSSAVHELADQTRPRHRWGLIYFLLIVFLLGVGPLPWLLARRGMKARWINVGMVLAIVAATWLLAVIGRRGYDERETVLSLACARPLGGGAWDVEQLSSFFVTSSGDYRVAHGGAPNLYACPAGEPVDAAITASGGGELASSIPLYSSRFFLLRARLDGPPLDLALVDDAQLATIKLRLGALPPGGIHRACLVVGGYVHPLAITPRADGSAELVAEAGSEPLDQLRQRAGYVRYSWTSRDLGSVFDGAFDALVSEAMGGDGAEPNRISVLLCSDQPEGFRIPGGGVDQRGRVLYRIDLPLAQPGPVGVPKMVPHHLLGPATPTAVPKTAPRPPHSGTADDDE